MLKRLSFTTALALTALTSLPAVSQADEHRLDRVGRGAVAVVDGTAKAVRRVGDGIMRVGDGVVRAGDKAFRWVLCDRRGV